MNTRLMTLLLTAVICMIGITLAIEQEQQTPIVISGYVTYINGDPVKNLTMTITKTNQNTSENFTAITHSDWNYYRMQTESTHLCAGDRIRINASDEACYNETVHNITAEDIESGGFRQNLILVPGKPDLIIEEIKIDKNDTVFVEGCVYDITYKINNTGDANATESITSIKINGVEVATDPVPELLIPGGNYTNTLGHFVFPCNQTVNVTVCADRNNTVEEINETNNCSVWEGKCLECYPELKIVNHSETWVDLANMTYNISYTVKNVGNANASNSTTRICDKRNGSSEVFDPVGALAPGKNYSNTLPPFNLLPDRFAEIKICADWDGEEGNCIPDIMFGLPNLYIKKPEGEWFSWRNKTYNITYVVNGAGGENSTAGTAYFYIDGNLSNVTDDVPELAKRPSGGGYGGRHNNTVGTFTMTGDYDTFRVCVKCEDGEEFCSEEGVFRSAVCLAEDGEAFRCGDRVDKSCTLTGDMFCSYREKRLEGKKKKILPHGLFIAADNITIDGNGSAIIRDKRSYGCPEPEHPVDEHYLTYCGVKNRLGYKNVVIKNLEVRDFCTGIAIVNADNNSIENCSVHDNGAGDKYTYGITVVNSSNITIDNCSVYNTTGILTDENVCGGHGINFHDDCNYCEVTNSHIFNNYLSGILSSPTCKYLYIGNNIIEDNGYCNESEFCAGVNLHWKGGSGLTTNSTVENNVVLNNTGSGIYLAQGYTAIKNNTVRGSKNGTNVTGNGILIDGGTLTFVYNNTCCENEGMDIVNSVNSFATFGDDNTCDTTENYDDDDSIGCSFYCGGVKGVCKGATKNFRCGDEVTESCTFNHSMSCRGCDAEYGLIVGAENVTIDGAGYKLSGIFTGIGIFSNYTGVTVKNLQVEDFSTGMKIENVSANIIENCIVCRNRGGQTGINFSADNGTVRNNRIYDNNGTGIFVSGTNNIFENNTISRNKNGTLPGYGIYFRADVENNNNNISANFIGDNEGIIDIYNSDGASYIGDNNTCDTTYHYNDTRTTMGCTHAWTTPDLVIANKSEDWVGNGSTDYRITYTVENIGKRKSREAGSSTTYLFIDVLPDEVAKNPVGPLKPGDNYTSTFSYIASRSGESDRIKVCADGADDVKENNEANNFYCNDIGCYWLEGFFKLKDNEVNNCLENVFNNESGDDISSIDPDAACVGWHTDKEYKCTHSVLNTVEESCTFNGNMGCPAGQGLIVGRDGITIDGNGHVIIMNGTASCTSESDCGILNSGYDNVKITNLEVVRFCNGIYLNGESDPIYGNSIQNCIVRDNGASRAEGFHGIKMRYVYDSTIRNNIIKGTIAHVNPNPGCEDGGNGIFMYQCCDNDITEGNEIYGNKKGGIFMKAQSNRNNISYNDVYENGQGGIIVRCKSSNDNTIEHNEVLNNYGSGIFIGGNSNKLRNNAVWNNRDGGPYYADFVGGHGYGINIGRSDGSEDNKLYDNIICENDYLDIFVVSGVDGNTGTDNFCDTTTENYKDSNVTIGCRYPCPGPMPDLNITEVEVGWDVEGSTYTVAYTVKNIGTEKAGESQTHIYIDGVFKQSDSVELLEESESDSSAFDGSFTLSDDSVTITVCVDGEGVVPESDDDNNCLSKEFPPELTSITVSPEVANLSVGDTQIFTATAYDQNGDIMEEIAITWSSSPTFVGTVSATGLFTADGIGFATVTVSHDDVSGHANVSVKPEEIEPIEEPSWRSGGGGRPPAGEENITGYEPDPGEGYGEFGAGIGGEQVPMNESETVSSGKKTRTGHPFGIGGEIIETVKVVAPVFLIVMVLIVVALFYLGYYKEKRAHGRNFRRAK